MSMIRQKIEEYLDGALTPGERAELERTLAAEPEAAQLRAAMEEERALRGAALASYEPSAEEASRLAAQVMAACQESALEPVGRIGISTGRVWLKRLSGVAAALLLAAGCFVVGRATAPQPVSGPAGHQVAQAQQPVEIIRVLYTDEAGDPQMKEFASLDEANAFMRDATQRHTDAMVVASGSDLDRPLDPDRPGSF